MLACGKKLLEIVDAWRLRWGRFHGQTIDQSERISVVVPLCCFGAWKFVFWTSKGAVARERVINIVGPLIGAWRRVPPLMVVFHRRTIDRAMIYPLVVVVVVRGYAWNIDFRDCGGSTMCGGVWSEVVNSNGA
jgi:hypothetical protein